MKLIEKFNKLQGRSKIIASIAAIFASILFLPLVAGIFVSYRIGEKEKRKMVKYSEIAAVLLFSSVLSILWLGGVVLRNYQPSGEPAQIESQQKTNEPSQTVEAAVSASEAATDVSETAVNAGEIKEDGDDINTLKSEENAETQNELLYKVVKVVDGDTINVDMGGGTETIRLIGINTPETVDPRKLVECFGKEASDKAKEILNGKSVGLESDPGHGERDKYDRLLRYVFLEDGTNFNKLMISEGYAYEYTYDIPYKYQSEFKQAEKEAKENKRGLWADDTCAGQLTQPVSGPAPTAPGAEVALPATDSNAAPAEQSSCYCASNKYNCTDFKTHAEAQNLFECCKKQVGTDVHRLDSDSDGLACESLP